MITICRMVVYTLTGDDAEKINRRRTEPGSIADRLRPPGGEKPSWPEGAQAHIGNAAAEGQQFPALVVNLGTHPLPHGVGDPPINLQVFLDGNDVYWATSVKEDHSKEGAPGTWTWPARV